MASWFPSIKNSILIFVTLTICLITTSTSTYAKTYSLTPTDNIQDAINSASSGDTIQLAPGTYYQRFQIQNKSNITIQGSGVDTIISGAIPEFTEPNNRWNFEGTRTGTESGRTFSVWSTTIPSSYEWSTNQNNYGKITASREDGSMLWTYGSEAMFNKNHPPHKNGAGLYVSAERKIYITDIEDPNTQPLYISRIPSIVSINGGSNISLTDMTIQHGGRFMVQIRNASGPVIDNVLLKNAAGSLAIGNSTDFAITNSTIDRYWSSEWPWKNVKDSNKYNPRHMENHAILISDNAGPGRIANTTVSRHFNGIVILDGHDIIIEDNLLYDIPDDSLEFEARPQESVENIIVRRNKTFDVFTAYAGVPTHDGPVYLYDNIFVADKVVPWTYDHSTKTYTHEPGRALKIWGLRDVSSYNNDASNIHIYNNTLYSPEPILFGINDTSRTAKDITMLNNIVYSTDGVLINRSGLLKNGVSYQSNLFFTPSSTANTYSYIDSYTDRNPVSTLDDAAFPIEWKHNQEADPLFAGSGDINQSTIAHYFALSANSPARSMQNTNIPSVYPDAGLLNKRTYIGALIPSLQTTDTPVPTNSLCSIEGDIDCSGEINLLDLSIMLADYGSSKIRSDLDKSGEVNILDLSSILLYFGRK